MQSLWAFKHSKIMRMRVLGCPSKYLENGAVVSGRQQKVCIVYSAF